MKAKYKKYNCFLALWLVLLIILASLFFIHKKFPRILTSSLAENICTQVIQTKNLGSIKQSDINFTTKTKILTKIKIIRFYLYFNNQVIAKGSCLFNLYYRHNRLVLKRFRMQTSDKSFYFYNNLTIDLPDSFSWK